MSLIRCPDCGNKISTSATACPKCGRPVTPKQATKKKGSSLGGCLAIVVITIGAVVYFGTRGSDPNKTPEIKKNSSGTDVANRIPYSVLENLKGTHGSTWVVLLDQKYLNEKDLRALGETLRYDRRNEELAVVMVFDDKKAAAMQKNWMKLNDQDGEFFDKHLIATYTRNMVLSNKQHNFVVNLDGKGFEVKY
ncbi:MAG: zinc-ribbon domain-containing protein [Planctomycetes bacterium]|nr:zinc-ribbon domain-containing protein [Planctomycetota bacterium]